MVAHLIRSRMSYNSKYKSAVIESLLDKIAGMEGGGKTSVILHDEAESSVELTANALHKWGRMDSLSLTLPEDADGMVSEYQVVFMAASSEFSLSLPAGLRWSNAMMPEFVAGQQYELNIRDGRVVWSQFSGPAPAGEYLQYVENDGVDYIMTDIYMSDKMYGMRCKAAALFAPGQTTNYAVAGTRQVTGLAKETSFFMWYLSGQQGRMLYWNGANKDAFGAFANGQVYEDVWKDEQNLVASDYPLIVFGGNNAGTPAYNNRFRVYGLELLDRSGNALVSLKPYRRASDGAVGLLDDMSGTFYPSVNGDLVGA